MFVYGVMNLFGLFTSLPHADEPTAGLFGVIEKNGRHFPKLNNVDKTHEIEDYLNQWNQINDFRKSQPTNLGISKPNVFITGYDDRNLEISKREHILGWVNNSRYLSEGSLVFVFNKDKLLLETCFKINSKLNDNRLIWNNEITSNKKIYNNRWNAITVSDGLNIALKEINKISPFDKEPFQGLLRDNFPMPIDSPSNIVKYAEFKKKLLQKIGYRYDTSSYDSKAYTISEFEDSALAFPKPSAIDEGVRAIRKTFLVDEDVIKEGAIQYGVNQNLLLYTSLVGTFGVLSTYVICIRYCPSILFYILLFELWFLPIDH